MDQSMWNPGIQASRQMGPALCVGVFVVRLTDSGHGPH
jgi:hypothetical protein